MEDTARVFLQLDALAADRLYSSFDFIDRCVEVALGHLQRRLLGLTDLGGDAFVFSQQLGIVLGLLAGACCVLLVLTGVGRNVAQDTHLGDVRVVFGVDALELWMESFVAGALAGLDREYILIDAVKSMALRLDRGLFPRGNEYMSIQRKLFSSHSSARLRRQTWGELFGRFIRHDRLKTGRSVEECARLAGMSAALWELIEAGQVPATREQLKSMAAALDMEWSGMVCSPSSAGERGTKQLAIRTHNHIGSPL